MKIDQATQMPARARFPKKCRMGSQSSSSSAGITEGKGTTKQTRQSVERLVADALAADHLERLRQDLELADGSDAGRSNRQLSRLLAETIGRIGRARWEYERKGKGRMACWKIKVCPSDSGIGALTDLGLHLIS